MPRRRLSAPVARPLRISHDELQSRAGSMWWVRRLSPSTSGKVYRCPGCQRELPATQPHVLVWPEVKSLLSEQAIDERRHWHTACWERAH